MRNIIGFIKAYEEREPGACACGFVIAVVMMVAILTIIAAMVGLMGD